VSWETSQEVPTIYPVMDKQGIKRLILFSGLYPIRMAVSEDDGKKWTELEPIGDFGGIVAMASCIPLKNGDYMALFHDDGRFLHKDNQRKDPPVFHVYKTLSRDGGLTWEPPSVIAHHSSAHLCEPGLIRSPNGDQIAMLLRENSRQYNSFVSFSNDEGETWSVPQELPGSLTGDRHTAKYAQDGRLFITFRDKTHESLTHGDWVGWVGTYDDILNGREGQYRVRLMDNTKGSDTSYPGLELLPDGTFVTTTYGHWVEGEQPFIVSVRFSLEELDERLLSIKKTVFQSYWPDEMERSWVGPEFWANRLQDWGIRSGRLECLSASEEKPMRTVHLLTRRLNQAKKSFQIKVNWGAMDQNIKLPEDAAAGFLLGAGAGLDHRAAALIHHSYGEGGGLFFGVDGTGKLFVRDFEKKDLLLAAQDPESPLSKHMELLLSMIYQEWGYTLKLENHDSETGKILSRMLLRDIIPSDRLIGNVALVSHPGTGKQAGNFWFKDWVLSGEKFDVHENHICGPILSTQYTLSHKVLKMTAQMMPISENDTQEVELQTQNRDQWETAALTTIIRPGFTATFRLHNWDESRDIPYRVCYRYKQSLDKPKTYFRTGIIRRNPIDKEEMIVASFTGNHNTQSGVDGKTFPWKKGIWFPHTDIIKHTASHNPDFLFFSGDQVYEGASPTRADLTHPFQDYLYKWYLWCWAFRDLTADIPSVVIPDDHDVFHGNIWGAGGKATSKGLSGAEGQDSGGYKLSPDFVNMVERTQTSHLPDPYDPTPVLQGINVYYCEMNYGGISFAVIEDRKFKSAPKPLLPNAEIWNGWYQNPKFDPKKEADIPEADLLGERQLEFLEHWTSDWSEGTWMKVLLSQTLFSNVATLPKDATSGAVIPSLPLLKPEEYAEDDRPVADMDSNGWPQSGRNRALRVIRKGFTVHICGDQHLGSTIQYGIEDWNDAGYALCVPSIANFWPRRWYPKDPGKKRKPGSPLYTGEFEDGFGNKITVYAVSNPVVSEKEPARLHDRSPGYGITRFFRSTRKIVFENWPRGEDPAHAEASPYPGWPIEFQQLDNYRKKSEFYLPLLKINSKFHPVLQVIDEETDEILYSLRINTKTFLPRVFKKGIYTLRLGEPGTEIMKIFSHIPSTGKENKAEISIDLDSH